MCVTISNNFKLETSNENKVLENQVSNVKNT